MQVATPVPVLSLFCQLKALSASERIRPFDKDADGTLLSEGVGMAVLKRRSQAERDGDRIYAFIKGTGVASDGRAVSVLAPRVEGEELALRRAYDGGGVAPATVGLIEAHGTGTPVGDATEVEALTRVFGDAGAAPRCALGSVKSMIGHTMPAAGMAGLHQGGAGAVSQGAAADAARRRAEPAPRARAHAVLHQHRDAAVDPRRRDQPRRAGVNAFGFGGINAHVVARGSAAVGAPAPTLDTDWDSEVCLFSGATRAEVVALARSVAALLALEPCAGACRHRVLAEHASPARVLPGARSALSRARPRIWRASWSAPATRLADPACREDQGRERHLLLRRAAGARAASVAFLFPGEGAQYVNMLSDLCRHFPEVRECFDAMDRVLFNHPRGYLLSELCFRRRRFRTPNAQARRAPPVDRWTSPSKRSSRPTTRSTRCCNSSASCPTPSSATARASSRRCAPPGMFDEDGYDQRVVELNDDHGRAAEAGDLPGGARLIAVGAARERVEALCASARRSGVCVAMDNCRHQVVVIGRAGAATRSRRSLRAEGLLYEALAFDRPYHTPFFTPFADTLNRALRQWIVRPAAVPLYSCTSTEPYPAAPAGRARACLRALGASGRIQPDHRTHVERRGAHLRGGRAARQSHGVRRRRAGRPVLCRHCRPTSAAGSGLTAVAPSPGPAGGARRGHDPGAAVPAPPDDA